MPGTILVVGGVIVLAVVPPLIGGFLPHSLAGYLIFGLFALSVSLITGYGRLLNIGVGATFGVGSYSVAVLSQHGVFNPYLLLLGALICGVLVSVLFGIYAILVSGIEYMMLTFLTTLAFATIPASSVALFGGDNGLSAKGGLTISFGLNPLQGNGFYWFVLGVTTLCALLSWFVLSSQAGRAARAIGRNPVRASAMGYNIAAYRMALTIYSGLIAATAGWLYALQTSFVFQDLLGLGNSLNGLVYALIGGANSIIGPFLGAAGLRYVTELFSQKSTQSSIYVGVVLLVAVYFVPDGIVGVWRWLVAKRRSSWAAEKDMEAAPLTLQEENV